MSSVALAALAMMLAAPPGAGAHEGQDCVPGQNGCMPTPEQCQTGQYNGFYDGGAPGRFAVCVGRDGRIVTYFGGEPANLCGVGMVNDLVVALDQYGRDPNQCSRNSLLSNPMTHTPNLQHIANVPPHAESDAQAHTQTDLAFWGRLAFEGNYGGMRIIDIGDPAQPVVLADLECYGPQGDVSVWNDLLIVSVDRPMANTSCEDAGGVPSHRIHGLRRSARVPDQRHPRCHAG